MKEIIRCGDCWAHYPIGRLHVCDLLMKMLVERQRRNKAIVDDEKCPKRGWPKHVNGWHWGEKVN